MGYYDEIAKSYDELHGEEQKQKAKIILANLEIKPSDKLLDIGCGTGIATELFPCDKTGIDPSAELLKHAKFPVKQAFAEDLPFPDKSFNIVISLTAVHNFKDIKKGLEEIQRVAKRDIIISVLKKSIKFKEIENTIKDLFEVKSRIDALQDVIFFCRKI